MRNVAANGADDPHQAVKFNPNDRRHFVGGSDARIIMGDDPETLMRLWREKRGEIGPDDLSNNLVVHPTRTSMLPGESCI